MTRRTFQIELVLDVDEDAFEYADEAETAPLNYAADGIALLKVAGIGVVRITSTELLTLAEQGGGMTTERPPVPCIYCGLEHDSGTACPPLEFPGTEWDQ